MGIGQLGKRDFCYITTCKSSGQHQPVFAKAAVSTFTIAVSEEFLSAEPAGKMPFLVPGP